MKAFAEKAQRSKELIKELELSESDISLLDPPEKRIKPREENVRNLRTGMTELSELRENISHLIKKHLDSSSEILKKIFPELYVKLSNVSNSLAQKTIMAANPANTVKANGKAPLLFRF